MPAARLALQSNLEFKKRSESSLVLEPLRYILYICMLIIPTEPTIDMHVPKGIGHLKSLCRSICDICDLLSKALSTQRVGGQLIGGEPFGQMFDVIDLPFTENSGYTRC